MMQRSFARSTHGSGVVDVLAQIRAKINSRNHQVWGLRQEAVQCDDHRVRGRAVDSPLPLAYFVTNNRLPQGERLRGSALLAAWRNNADRAESFEPCRQCLQPGSVNSIIIRQ